VVYHWLFFVRDVLQNSLYVVKIMNTNFINKWTDTLFVQLLTIVILYL